MWRFSCEIESVNGSVHATKSHRTLLDHFMVAHPDSA